MRITDEQGRKWEMAHLSQRLFKTGDTVKAGQKAFVTGGRPGEYSSGQTTTGPHLHLQIILSNGTRVDPWPLLSNAPMPTPFEQYNEKIVRNTKNGSYALVIRGKKYVFGQAFDVPALLTFIQRNQGNLVGKTMNIDPAVFDSIPASQGLSF